MKLDIVYSPPTKMFTFLLRCLDTNAALSYFWQFSCLWSLSLCIGAGRKKFYCQHEQEAFLLRPRQPCLPLVQENAWSLTSPSNTATYFGAQIPKVLSWISNAQELCILFTEERPDCLQTERHRCCSWGGRDFWFVIEFSLAEEHADRYGRFGLIQREDWRVFKLNIPFYLVACLRMYGFLSQSIHEAAPVYRSIYFTFSFTFTWNDPFVAYSPANIECAVVQSTEALRCKL